MKYTCSTNPHHHKEEGTPEDGRWDSTLSIFLNVSVQIIKKRGKTLTLTT